MRHKLPKTVACCCFAKDEQNRDEPKAAHEIPLWKGLFLQATALFINLMEGHSEPCPLESYSNNSLISAFASVRAETASTSPKPIASMVSTMIVLISPPKSVMGKRNVPF